jgi:hypothetical protein
VRRSATGADESQSPWSSPLPKAFAPASPTPRRPSIGLPQHDNYVLDSITESDRSSFSAASLLPPSSSFASISPSSSPQRSTGFRDLLQPSSPSSASPYSDVFEYQRQNSNQPRERSGSSGGSRPIPVVQTTFHGPTTNTQSPSAETCFYLDGESVKVHITS